MKLMHAILVAPDRSLTWGQTERPIPAAGELLVEVRATAVNRADLLQRSGKYPPPPGASPVLGLEVAGSVVELGAGCRRFSVGDRVFGLVPGGSYAEYAVIDEMMAMPTPQSLTDEEAAAIPEAFLTAYQGLVWLGRLKPDEWVLIHAAGSGVGTAAIQLAGVLGARVVTTSSPEKAPFCRSLGAEETLVGYDVAAHTGRLTELTAPGGLAVILDPLGPPLLASHLELLGIDGRLVVIALMAGTISPEADLRAVLRKRLSIFGTTLRNRPRAYQRALAAEFHDFAAARLSDRSLRPIISHTCPLPEAARAHELMEQRKNLGKIVLTNQPR